MYKVGDVFRPVNSWTFGDSVITSVKPDGNYTLSRPYLYASPYGSVLVGYETIDGITDKTLLEHWKKIDSGRVL